MYQSSPCEARGDDDRTMLIITLPSRHAELVSATHKQGYPDSQLS